MRSQILAATLGKVPGVRYAVAGDTASSHDFTRQLHNRAPVVLGLVAVLAFVLLLASFRSVAIPLVSIILNLMSVGAAYGLITLIFQDGRLQGALGHTAFGGIISWVPLFMFVFLFGISMDYHVFILSRIRELWSHGFLPRDAVVGGIASSARCGDQRGADHGGGLLHLRHHVARRSQDPRGGHGRRRADRRHRSRGILLPAALALLGDHSWYAPRWLRRPRRRDSVPSGA
ncbi:MAG TPA: MMPL family transporter [Streptosporangiaceae bacterium]|nr:MMPL family transporter [Streptosporangiaceae bacterium]